MLRPLISNLRTYALTRLRTSSGVALILVLSAIVLLTAVTIDFAYNRQMEYQMAHADLKRLQAYYLAESGYKLMLLELKVSGMVQSTLAGIPEVEGLKFDASLPLCVQLPISSTLLRVAAGMGGEVEDEKAKRLSAFPIAGAEEFLKFQGDFDGECLEEASKIDLNYFYKLDPEKVMTGGESDYDHYRKLVMLAFKEGLPKDFFKDEPEGPSKLVRNIADWIDKNSRINELGGVAVGDEESLYTDFTGEGGFLAGPKNGKLTTPGDIFRVADMEDDLWEKLEDRFTIYGDGKVNVCRAPESVLKALVRRYLESRSDLPPLRAGEEELPRELAATVKKGCTGARPDTRKIAGDLDAKIVELFGASPMAASVTPPDAAIPTGGPGVAPGAAGLGSSFANWITGENRYFTLRATGTVGQAKVRITSVIDLGEGGGFNPRNWKTLYWRID